MSRPENAPKTDERDDRLAAFLAQASAVEPARMATPAQLLWRAEVLARLERDEVRARRAAMPMIVALALGSGLGLLTLTLAIVADFGAAGGIASWFVASPVRPIGCSVSVLVAMIAFFVFTRPPRRTRVR